MKEYFNCFVGIPINPQYIYDLQNILDDLRQYIPKAAITETKTAHLTLYYLGKQSVKNLEVASNIIFEDKEIISGEKIQIGKLGIFNSNEFAEPEPYVVYLKVNHSHKLLTLREHFSSHLEVFNREEERGFIPHITLARLKTPESKIQFEQNKNEIEKLLEKINWEWEMKEIYIYGKTSPETAKFQDVLFKIPLI